jgi:hypothetical protein
MILDHLDEHPSVSFELLDWSDALVAECSFAAPAARLEEVHHPTGSVLQEDGITESKDVGRSFLQTLRRANANLILGSDLVSLCYVIALVQRGKRGDCL